MLITKLIASLLINTIICQWIPSRKFTDYYELMGSELCIPIRHTLPKGSEFIRLHIRYFLDFMKSDSELYNETNYYLKRTDRNDCFGKIEFSSLGREVNFGSFGVSMSWDISDADDIASFDYYFYHKIDSSIAEIVSNDDLFAIPVKLSKDGQYYLYISQFPVNNVINLLSLFVNDNKAICVKVDNNKIIILNPNYVDDSPTLRISYVKIDAMKAGSVFSKKYNAYACGSGAQHPQSNFKLVVDGPEVTTKFYVVSRRYTFILEEKYEIEEINYEFNLNNDNNNYEYADNQTNLYYEDPKIYLFETSETKKQCSSQKYILILGKSYQNRNLYCNTERYVEVSENIRRIRIEPQLSILPC